MDHNMADKEIAISQNDKLLNQGESARRILLSDITGEPFDSAELHGRRYMISFFRFASCPFCNLRVRELVTRHSELASDFTIVAIFDSPLENLRKYAKDQNAPFPILADEENIYYKEYGIKHSWTGVLKGLIIRFPALLKAMLAYGYWPFQIEGKIHTMPADFLVDENSIIQLAYYGKDEGDHLSFDIINSFSNKLDI